MRKIIIFICVAVVLIIGYWLLSPFFINKKVSEDLPFANNPTQNSEVNLDNMTQTENVVNTSDQVIEIKKGSFTGFDKIHTGSGTARIVSVEGKNYIRFEDDFNVNNGPDLYVGLGKDGSYIKGSELGKLKGNIGSQNYELPENIDPKNVEEVWVWCKAFSVPFTKAILN